VKRVLHEIGADHVPQWLIFNKIDNLPLERQPLEFQDQYEVDGMAFNRIFVSAQTGQSVSLLRQMLAEEVMKATPALEPIRDQRFDLDNYGENPDEFA
jgi:GTP-binding protein HflX